MTTPRPPRAPWTPDDMGKSYQIVVEWEEIPTGETVDVHMVGPFTNGGTYPVPQEKVTEFENSMRIPFSELYVPPNCQIQEAE